MILEQPGRVAKGPAISSALEYHERVKDRRTEREKEGGGKVSSELMNLPTRNVILTRIR